MPRAIGLKFYYVTADPKVDDQHICPKVFKLQVILLMMEVSEKIQK